MQKTGQRIQKLVSQLATAKTPTEKTAINKELDELQNTLKNLQIFEISEI